VPRGESTRPGGLPLIVLHLGFLALLMVGLPALAYLQARLLARLDPEALLVRSERSGMYRDTLVVLCVLGAVALALGIPRFGTSALGLALPVGGTGALLGWTAAGLAGGLLVVGGAHLAGLSLGIPERPLLEALLPESAGERAFFAAISAAAAGGEELAYRGYALVALGSVLGPVGAALATSVSFGFAHAYQGPLGIIRTGLTGLVLAGITLAVGSLWPAVAAHTLLNLILGLAGGERLLRRSALP
jgi:membrane protease YdiL (CAAX protease family)